MLLGRHVIGADNCDFKIVHLVSPVDFPPSFCLTIRVASLRFGLISALADPTWAPGGCLIKFALRAIFISGKSEKWVDALNSGGGRYATKTWKRLSLRRHLAGRERKTQAIYNGTAANHRDA